MLKKHEKMFECLGILSTDGEVLKKYPELKQFIEQTIMTMQKSEYKIIDFAPNRFVLDCFLDVLFEVCCWLLPLKGYYDRARIDCLSELKALNGLPDIQSRYECIRDNHSDLRNAIILGYVNNNNARIRFYSKYKERIAEVMYDFLCKEFKIYI